MRLFGTSGIRGVYGADITEELAASIGLALGRLGYKSIAVGSDTRLSADSLKAALFSGMHQEGCLVTDFGVVPTPVLCYGIKKNGFDCGVMITASHNPAKYNGFKLWNSEGRAFDLSEERKLEDKIAEVRLNSSNNNSDGSILVGPKKTRYSVKNHDITSEYFNEIKKRFKLKGKMKVLVDAGNGAASNITSRLISSFGYDVVLINDIPDGSFPNRNPEPSETNLKGTASLVVKNKCVVGFCHDGDADRMIAIDDKGRVVNFDKFLTFLAQNMVMSGESDDKTVVTTVDASMLIDAELADVKVLRSKVGDVFVATDCEKSGACFGGEPSGSFIFPEFGLWPDGVYAVFKTLQFLEKEVTPLSKILDSMPNYPFVRTKLSCSEKNKVLVMNKIKDSVPKEAKVSFVDGIRIDFGDANILVRPSGTEEYIRINVEAKTMEKLNKLRNEWQSMVSRLINEFDGSY